ncbi:hypothetical protein [Amnibacterium kyonggiense]|uniref:Uncharacterized protein n=1 Tax=Amnibacterium kyonggiense TaxID=595671 RepID=A0A4R7FQ61_9MICO|nr:hypothetical protein [Amnibacterium kyonggiense]TDS79910.1 hypothetical protein CLV52_0456 [Amnibacterium kyonggiense]
MLKHLSAYVAAGALLATALVAAPAEAAPVTAPAAARLTNTAHLDFLLQEVRPPATAGHSTYGSAPVELPWTYADRNDDGSYTRVGGGTYDAATDTYGQGAFNTDDVARTAVVYVRDWRQTGSAASREHAEAVLRGLAFFQTTTGPHAGNPVLWMQPDGALNPSADPVELPDPSDSGPSYWLARTIWAYGEGYAAFRHSDPGFARFLQQRLRLAVRALDRETLRTGAATAVADGVRVPGRLIVDDAGASAEAVLGLAAYAKAAPKDVAPRRALASLAGQIDRLAATTPQTASWPYGAILPSAASRTSWHAWASQMSAALAAACSALHRPALLRSAVRDTAGFEPDLLAAGGADNLLGPTPSDRTQIAYGVDSRVQGLLAVSDRTGSRGVRALAALQAAWFFGANASGSPVYDPATGVTFDGVQADGTVNRNSGAESTIHGLLTMLALDAHPSVARAATAIHGLGARDGLRVVEAEDAATTGTVFTPDPASTAESAWSGKGLLLRKGRTATFHLGTGAHEVEAVVQQVERGTATAPVSRWTGGGVRRSLTSTVDAQGISPTSGALAAQTIGTVHGDALTVRAIAGAVRIDALLVRPEVQRVAFDGGPLLLVDSGRGGTAAVDRGARVERYRGDGTPAGVVTARSGRVALPKGGFAVVR